MKNPWVIALGLMLLFEGILPFLFPGQWRDTFRRIAQLSDGQIRFFGLIALLLGVAVLSTTDFFS